MRIKTDEEYLRLNKWNAFWYKFALAFTRIPGWFVNKGKKIGNLFKRFGLFIINDIKDIITTFKNGDWKTRISYFILGFGNAARGQWLRGLLFFLTEVAFVLYMVFVGGENLVRIGSLGDVALEKVTVTVFGKQKEETHYIDNSFKIMLYGILSIFFIIALIYTWRLNIKQNKIAQEIEATGKKIKSSKDDLHSLVDDQFHKTLLALPVLGITLFTIFPTVFMILVAFTNFDYQHNPPFNLFDWTGLNQFMFWGDNSEFGATFAQILVWTLIWAFFATFTNYFLGMLVALLINKKGIKFKKLWRGILVVTIAVPQFISLLYVSKMFGEDGVVNGWLGKTLPFWTNPTWARVTVILINVWVGIPYLMLITSGILMNIPQDLYESAKVDGASVVQQYFKITLPYTLFVTGPYLLTSFIGNMNNFNVIYLLTGGKPDTSELYGVAGRTDLLITWLFKITVDNDPKYNLGATIGILIFISVSVISLIVYNFLPSVKNEEDYQ